MSQYFMHFPSNFFLLQNTRLLLDNFGLTKSCYWTVSNFSDPCQYHPSAITPILSHLQYNTKEY